VRPRHSVPLLASGRRLSDGPAGLEVAFIETSLFGSWLTEQDRHPLAVMAFGTPPPAGLDCPVASLHLQQLIGPPQVEVWSSGQPVRTLHKDAFSAAMNDDVAAGCLSVESRPGTSLEAVTYQAYCRLLDELQALGYPYPWRAWNYFPGINDDDGWLERYQRFSVGRYDALAKMLAGFPVTLPAATAVGTRSGPLTILILAGAHQASHLGNPRQVHAYEYPSRYGPRSPSFARATIGQVGEDRHLFVAGTASVVGHETRHLGLPREQTCETLENLESLLHHADEFTGYHVAGIPHRTLYKVYARTSDHLPVIRRALADSSLTMDHCLFLQGDLCRKELLVEIEAVITSD
jgi:chorismate lyase / 3-hydroxybenzoate synthase